MVTRRQRFGHRREAIDMAPATPLEPAEERAQLYPLKVTVEAANGVRSEMPDLDTVSVSRTLDGRISVMRFGRWGDRDETFAREDIAKVIIEVRS